MIARQGDVTLIGQQVNIVAALDTARSKEFHEIKQSGLSVTASNPVVSAVQTGERMASAASKVDNPVMQAWRPARLVWRLTTLTMPCRRPAASPTPRLSTKSAG